MLNTNMTCPLQTGNEDVLLDYCARSLDAERTAMLESHFKQCAHCRETATAHSEIWAAMDAFDAEPISAGFDRELYARIKQQEEVPAWERLWAPVRQYLQGQPAWKPVLSLAAASAVVAVVFLVQGDGTQPAPDPAVAIDVRVVEQAERALEDMDMLRQFELAAPADSGGAGEQKEVL